MPAVGKIQIETATVVKDEEGYHTLSFNCVSVETPEGTVVLTNATWAQWSRSVYNPDGLRGGISGTCIEEPIGAASKKAAARGQFRAYTDIHLANYSEHDGKAHFALTARR